ncbi:MAG: DUF3783 domain-containing protein [Thermoplasmata archaeon]|nr:DUF3783 domain-containing protein [Thermoplasmata archaeon]
MTFRKLGNDERKNEGPRIILLHNFSDKEVLEFLDYLKKNENLKKSIVAVTTPTSLNMRVGELMNELRLEDEEINKNKEKK